MHRTRKQRVMRSLWNCIVKLARLLGREVATPAQAREMLGLGAPRAYD